MRVGKTMYRGRQAWELDNDCIRLVMSAGGGNIASLVLGGEPRINPLWVPVWKPMEPWNYRPKHAARYGGVKLHSCISGHNPCLGWFGLASAEETAAGMGVHGEAAVARWKLVGRKQGRGQVSFTAECELPAAGMRYRRTISSRKGSNVIRVAETVRNLRACDVPFTMCQHVAMGPPFLEKGVTLFDMPAVLGHTFPGKFGATQRLRSDTAFKWPTGPGANGKKVDLRVIGREYKVSSDFSTQLIDVSREDAWFSAVNPKRGLMLAYVWKRADYPWVGNWEENYGRKQKPWDGRSLIRGMEFANTPFPASLREQVSMGRFQGQPSFRWLTARGSIRFDYRIILMPVPREVKGVTDIRPRGSGFEVVFRR